ncbi:hypothetical protein AGR6A_pAt20007 [Agrobacterium sp. NCPPB 925]|nr:hypothetical protein AGR6A_pAt20007 [Agrobacterium sp. NCPPB 925]
MAVLFAAVVRWPGIVRPDLGLNGRTIAIPTKQVRLLDDDARFAELKINRDVPQTWEDGFRLSKPFLPGAYEWWYADAHFSNGYFCIVAHNVEINADGELCAFIRLDIAKDGKKLSEQKMPVNSNELQIADTHCDARMGPHFFRSEGGSLDRYHIFVDPDSAGGFGMDITLPNAECTVSGVARSQGGRVPQLDLSRQDDGRSGRSGRRQIQFGEKQT